MLFRSVMHGKQLAVHDFSSADGEHGYGVDVARWTPDSRFFVCLMSNSGGHSPLYSPVVFWSRKTNRLHELDAYTGDRLFAIIAPDRVRVKTWPGLEPAIVALDSIKQGEATELRQVAGVQRRLEWPPPTSVRTTKPPFTYFL